MRVRGFFVPFCRPLGTISSDVLILENYEKFCKIKKGILLLPDRKKRYIISERPYQQGKEGQLMEDQQIIELFWQRDEAAVSETETKYGWFCYSISDHILHNREDAEECVNDTLLAAWNTIPPQRPVLFSAYLGKITRRLSLKKLRAQLADKRGGGKPNLAFDELDECIPSGQRMDEQLEAGELTRIIDDFLGTLRTAERRVFLRRYWYYDSISEISKRFGYSEGKIKMILMRTRDKLRVRLSEEDIWI